MLFVPLLQGYGPNGLGIITVSGVPNFIELRRRLLPLAQQFAVSETTESRNCAGASEPVRSVHETANNVLFVVFRSKLARQHPHSAESNASLPSRTGFGLTNAAAASGFHAVTVAPIKAVQLVHRQS